MAKKKTQFDVILSTLKTRKNGFTDAELIEKTGLPYANTLRAHLKKAGLVSQIGTKKSGKNGRTVKTWGVVSA